MQSPVKVRTLKPFRLGKERFVAGDEAELHPGRAAELARDGFVVLTGERTAPPKPQTASVSPGSKKASRLSGKAQ